VLYLSPRRSPPLGSSYERFWPPLSPLSPLSLPLICACLDGLQAPCASLQWWHRGMFFLSRNVPEIQHQCAQSSGLGSKRRMWGPSPTAEPATQRAMTRDGTLPLQYTKTLEHCILVASADILCSRLAKLWDPKGRKCGPKRLYPYLKKRDRTRWLEQLLSKGNSPPHRAAFRPHSAAFAVVHCKTALQKSRPCKSMLNARTVLSHRVFSRGGGGCAGWSAAHIPSSVYRDSALSIQALR
jgi:hypothetical protein